MLALWFENSQRAAPAPTSEAKACLTEGPGDLSGLIDEADCHVRLKDLVLNSPEQAARNRAVLNAHTHRLHAPKSLAQKRAQKRAQKMGGGFPPPPEPLLSGMSGSKLQQLLL
jgi:hypothetical protein